MQSDRRDAGALDQEPESTAGVAGMQGAAVFADEHVPGVDPRLPRRLPAGFLVSLALPVVA